MFFEVKKLVLGSKFWRRITFYQNIYQATWQTTANLLIWLPISGPKNSWKISLLVDQVRRGLVKGTSMVEGIEVKFRISKMKPLHVSWLIDFFNELTSPNDKKVITSGWRRSEILDAITLSLKSLLRLRKLIPLKHPRYQKFLSCLNRT